VQTAAFTARHLWRTLPTAAQGSNGSSTDPLILTLSGLGAGMTEMNHRQVERYWNENADLWAKLTRAGYDVYRDYLNTPAFFRMLPEVGGLSGLDIGCGEGHNTRLLAKRGARVTAVDISEVLIRHANQLEDQEPQGIEYLVASAVELPFADSSFDFVTAFMSFMDIPETDQVLAEAYRLLKPGGFLQFSITHPCFDTPHRRNLRDEHGHTYAIEVGDYFRNLQGEITEWLFSTVPPKVKEKLPKFKIPGFTRTLSQWLNLLIEKGFLLERVEEPRPSDETVRECPDIQDAQVVAYFLHVRARKLSSDNASLRRPT
jgi:ubiquinone/menaquinone biosynthesis C-methylase UbiE